MVPTGLRDELVKQGKKYYDYRLTKNEKTKLIDLINQPASGFTTAGNESFPPDAEDKDRKFISMLQNNPEEIVSAFCSESHMIIQKWLLMDMQNLGDSYTLYSFC
ncbi:MAG: hypothetical protein J5548_06435 [Prevotella sp.]|nr:hypothetical protein [Prevotella sp.]